MARVLHTLGEAATVCVPLGGDTGRFIREELSAYGVDRDFVETQQSDADVRDGD